MKTNTKTAAVSTPATNAQTNATPVAGTTPAKPVAALPPATLTPVAKPTANPTRLGKSGIAVLTAISKEPLTRSEIGLRTGIKSGFCSLLGHVDVSKTEPSSLSYKGYLTVLAHMEGKSASCYQITDKGREALKAATTAPVIPVTPPASTAPKVEAKPVTQPAATPVKAAAKKVTPKK